MMLTAGELRRALAQVGEEDVVTVRVRIAGDGPDVVCANFTGVGYDERDGFGFAGCTLEAETTRAELIASEALAALPKAVLEEVARTGKAFDFAALQDSDEMI